MLHEDCRALQQDSGFTCCIAPCAAQARAKLRPSPRTPSPERVVPVVGSGKRRAVNVGGPRAPAVTALEHDYYSGSTVVHVEFLQAAAGDLATVL
jgi:hypothetical protein